jgi:hypothetical protein
MCYKWINNHTFYTETFGVSRGEKIGFPIDHAILFMVRDDWGEYLFNTTFDPTG